MSDTNDAGELPASDSQICDALWERIGKKTVEELPTQLGFQPEINKLAPNKLSFNDSGVEVTMWLDKQGQIAVLNVKRT
jgi:hypothetical protein